MSQIYIPYVPVQQNRYIDDPDPDWAPVSHKVYIESMIDSVVRMVTLHVLS